MLRVGVSRQGGDQQSDESRYLMRFSPTYDTGARTVHSPSGTGPTMRIQGKFWRYFFSDASKLKKLTC